MYILIDGKRYDNISRVRTSNGNVAYIGESLKDIESVGAVECFRDDGFYIMKDNAADWQRCVIRDGSVLLTNTPLPPEPSDSDEVSGDELLEAIEGVL